MKYMKLGSKPDAFQSEGTNIRIAATELATDIIVNVGNVKFYLHKFPLIAKSCRLQKLIESKNGENDDEIDIHGIPGGPAAFEICAKFCYGMIVTLNAYNVFAARCAAEYLEMHETIEKGNLVYKIDVFLNSSIFRAWKDAIIVLQTTKALLPWSEDLNLISHSVDSIATKASTDPSEVEWSYTYNRKKLPSENGMDQQWNGVMKQLSVPRDWWVEDICDLDMDLYQRVIVAIKVKEKVTSKVIGEALKAYSYRRIPGLSKGTITFGSDFMKIRNILETIVSLLPTDKGSVSCSFLLNLLKAASVLECEDKCRKELVRRVGRQLEEASVVDLLIPATAGENIPYNIDLVVSILEEFVSQDNAGTRTSSENADGLVETTSPIFASPSSKIAVSKLVDGYLAEIAKDPNLPIAKFIEISEKMSPASRPTHDGLYQAIDMYLKEHPGISKSEKKKLCGLMDCKKLSTDVCIQAMQNDRLPLRIVVQVLFFEQMRMAAASGVRSDLPESVRSLVLHQNGGSYSSSISSATTITENETDGIRTVVDPRFSSLTGKGRLSQRSNGSIDARTGEEKITGKVKGILTPKRMMNKLWTGMQSGESSSSDVSESPSSINYEESRSMPSRSTRHSLS